MMSRQNMNDAVAAIRARRRAAGMRSSETVLLDTEIAALDAVKVRLDLPSRSEVIRVLIAKVDLDKLTSADAAAVPRVEGY
jgi:hypothetical protein